MNLFMIGAVAMGMTAATLFFWRFWRATHDRLFALFALAFLILTVNRVGLAFIAQSDWRGDYLYWVRFVAYVLILVAILDKNRSHKLPDS